MSKISRTESSSEKNKLKDKLKANESDKKGTKNLEKFKSLGQEKKKEAGILNKFLNKPVEIKNEINEMLTLKENKTDSHASLKES
jgi:hypothetical protein